MSDITFFVNPKGGIVFIADKTVQDLSLTSELEALNCKYYFNQEDACRKAARSKHIGKTAEEMVDLICFAFSHHEPKIKTKLKGFSNNPAFPFYFNTGTAIIGFNDQAGFMKFVSEFDPVADEIPVSDFNAVFLAKK